MKDNNDQPLSEEQMETIQGGKILGVKFQYRCLICKWTTRWSDIPVTIEKERAQHEKDYKHYEWETRESGGPDFGF